MRGTGGGAFSGCTHAPCLQHLRALPFPSPPPAPFSPESRGPARCAGRAGLCLPWPERLAPAAEQLLDPQPGYRERVEAGDAEPDLHLSAQPSALKPFFLYLLY